MQIFSSTKKGRGAQMNPTNRFMKEIAEPINESDEVQEKHTQYIEVFPKTIINKVKSKDVPVSYSMNPYEGCEHGCVYCYARNTHPYWNLGAGLDFEQKILIKPNAPELLKATLNQQNWKPDLIMLSGNTDCYQPIEQKLELTCKLLQVLLQFRHPVGIITKNSLIQRDIELLQQLHYYNLVSVIISITTQNEELRRALEPRTATYKKRLDTVAFLAKHNIPVSVNIAPIIPGLNDNEIMAIAKAAAANGAQNIGYNIIRLPGEVEPIFINWLETVVPNRKDKILNQIKQIHGGSIQDAQYGRRMRGQGVIADVIKQQIQIARNNYFPTITTTTIRTDLFINDYNSQKTLFD